MQMNTANTFGPTGCPVRAARLASISTPALTLPLRQSGRPVGAIASLKHEVSVYFPGTRGQAGMQIDKRIDAELFRTQLGFGQPVDFRSIEWPEIIA